MQESAVKTPIRESDDFVARVHAKFRDADDAALFNFSEQALILDVSRSWLEKGHGPRSRLIGRLRKSTKADIIDYINALPDGGETTSYFGFA